MGEVTVGCNRNYPEGRGARFNQLFEPTPRLLRPGPQHGCLRNQGTLPGASWKILIPRSHDGEDIFSTRSPFWCGKLAISFGLSHHTNCLLNLTYSNDRHVLWVCKASAGCHVFVLQRPWSSYLQRDSASLNELELRLAYWVYCPSRYCRLAVHETVAEHPAPSPKYSTDSPALLVAWDRFGRPGLHAMCPYHRFPCFGEVQSSILMCSSSGIHGFSSGTSNHDYQQEATSNQAGIMLYTLPFLGRKGWSFEEFRIWGGGGGGSPKYVSNYLLTHQF